MRGKEIESEYQDVPNHETAAETSSIGGLWPPERSSFGRVKAFYTLGVIQDMEGLQPFLDSFAEQSDSLGEDVSRVQYRAVIDGGVLLERSLDENFRAHVEAVIPIDPGELGEEPVITYLSHNHICRSSDPIDVEKVRQNFQEARLTEKKTIQEIFDRAQLNGYRIDILSPNSADSSQELDQLTGLYKRFGWERNEVSELINNPNNTIAVARDGDEIVSAGIAEFAVVPVGSKQLRMVEITEAATADGHQRQGLYRAVSTELLIGVAKRSYAKGFARGEVDVVFGECNGLAQGVLKVARSQGRTFSIEKGGIYGFPDSGILEQQVPISGPTRRTEYNDLLPAYLTRSDLYKNYLL